MAMSHFSDAFYTAIGDPIQLHLVYCSRIRRVSRGVVDSLRKWRAVQAIVVLALAATTVTPASAERVIRIVVPFSAGSVLDAMARSFNNELGLALGATVIVDNRPGAGGTLGTALVAKSKPDGNTLIFAGANHMFAGHLYGKLTYDPVKDFTGVAYVGNTGYVVVAPGNLGVSTLGEYIKLIKSKPGQLNYASAGNGSANHLAMAYFLVKAGLEMQHVPTKSTGEAANELLAGRVQGMTVAYGGAAQFKQDPRVKLLAYTGAQRSRLLPELPTLSEAGVPGFKFDSWAGLLGPASMSKVDVDKIHAAMDKVLADPSVQDRLSRLGLEGGAGMSVEGFQKILKADYETAGVIVKLSGARIE